MSSSTFEARERSHLNEVATGHICKNNKAYEVKGLLRIHVYMLFHVFED